MAADSVKEGSDDYPINSQDDKGSKTTVVSQSRQREEAGARASATEVSPDRPHGSFLAEEQRLTSFVAAQNYANSGAHEADLMGRKTDAMPSNSLLQLNPL